MKQEAEFVLGPRKGFRKCLTRQHCGVNEAKIPSLTHPPDTRQSLTGARHSMSLFSWSDILMEGEEQSTCTQIRLVQIRIGAVRTIK